MNHAGEPTLDRTLGGLQLGGLQLWGIAAIWSNRSVNIGGQPVTAGIFTLSVFGALVMYVMRMAALFRLRRIAPASERLWTAPLYRWLPGLALGLVAMIWFNPWLFALFAGVMGVAVLVAWRRSPIIAVAA